MQTPSWQADLFYNQLSVTAFSVHKTAYGPHWHNRVEILYFLDDSPPTRCYYSGNRVDAVPGDLLIFNSNEVHALQLLDTRTSHLCIGIQRELLESFGFSPDDLNFRLPIRDQSLAELFMRVFNATCAHNAESDPSATVRLGIHAEALSLFARLVNEYTVPAEPTSNTIPQNKYDLTQAAIMYIQNHLAEPICLQDICDHLRVSASYLSHLFHETTGSTVISLINELRCRKLRSLLLSGQYNVNECAARCGFAHTSYMAKVYRQHYGESPSDTRKNNKSP